jgi:hypothetical protein
MTYQSIAWTSAAVVLAVSWVAISWRSDPEPALRRTAAHEHCSVNRLISCDPPMLIFTVERRTNPRRHGSDHSDAISGAENQRGSAAAVFTKFPSSD